MFFQGLHLHCQTRGFQSVIRAEDFHILTVRKLQRPVHIGGHVEMRIVVVNPDARIGGLGCKAFDESAGTVLRLVLHDHQFPIGIGLREHRPERFLQKRLGIVNRHTD